MVSLKLFNVSDVAVANIPVEIPMHSLAPIPAMRQMRYLVLFALTVAPIFGRAESQRVARVGVATILLAPAAMTGHRSDSLVRGAPELKGSRSSAANGEHAGAFGAGIGAALGGATGLLMGLSQCDAAGSHRGCVTEGAVGGVVVGAVIGYGIGWIIGNSRD